MILVHPEGFPASIRVMGDQAAIDFCLAQCPGLITGYRAYFDNDLGCYTCEARPVIYADDLGIRAYPPALPNIKGLAPIIEGLELRRNARVTWERLDYLGLRDKLFESMAWWAPSNTRLPSPLEQLAHQG